MKDDSEINTDLNSIAAAISYGSEKPEIWALWVIGLIETIAEMRQDVCMFEPKKMAAFYKAIRVSAEENEKIYNSIAKE